MILIITISLQKMIVKSITVFLMLYQIMRMILISRISFFQKEKIENLNNNSGDITIIEMKDNYSLIDKIDKENIQPKIKEKIFLKKPF